MSSSTTHASTYEYDSWKGDVFWNWKAADDILAYSHIPNC